MRPLRGKIKSKIKSESVGMGYRCQLKPKTPSSAARFSYINRKGKYARDSADLLFSADRNMPEFALADAAVFWENCDEYERVNARRCLEFELNLPAELDLKQQILCVESFIDSLNKKAGKFPISYAIHNDKDGTNPHVHLMLSERALDEIERPAELFFRRANSKNPERGGNKKSLFFNRSSENVLWTRASWANSCNETLIKNGHDARFDSRPKHVQRAEAIEQGDLVRAVQLSTLTEKHEGPHVGGIRKRLAAGQLERGDVELGVLEKLDSNDTIRDFNAELQQFAVTAPAPQLLAFLECESAIERVEFIANLIESAPEPAPQAAQAAQDADVDFLEDEDMTTQQETLKQKQLAALAEVRAEKAAHLELVQPEPPAELEAEPAPKLRLVQAGERAAEEPVPEVAEVAAEQQASRLAQLRDELEAQDAELAELAEQAQEADRFAAQQAQKAGELEQQYRESMRQQKELEAQASALEPEGWEAFFVFIARALGYRTQSDRLRQQAAALAGQRFEQQRTPLLDARAQAESAQAESAEARQDLQDAKAQRAKLVDAVMLERGTGALKKLVAREVQKLEKLEDDFGRLRSSKAFELQQRREAITEGGEPSDKELLRQAKALRELARSGARDYRGELLEVSKQAQKGAEAAYHQARETLRSAGDSLGSEYKKELGQQLDADRAHFLELMKDPKKRSDPQLFEELASETQQLDDMMQQHMQEAEQVEQLRQLERQQREAAPRQRQEHRSDFGL